MKNQKIIDALEQCKKVLVSELRSYVESFPGKEVNCWCPLPIHTDKTYNLDGYWVQNTVTRGFVDEDTGVLMAEFEDYSEQFQDSIEDCFDVMEIAEIIDTIDKDE